MFKRWWPRLGLGIGLVFALGTDEPGASGTQSISVACGASQTWLENAPAGLSGSFTVAACDCGPGAAAHVTAVKDGAMADLCTLTAGQSCNWTVPAEMADAQIVLGCDGAAGSGTGCTFQWQFERSRPMGGE